VLPQATLLPIVVASAEPGPAWRTPRGDAALLLEALGVAADLGARIVNVSLGVPVGEAELRRLAAGPVWDRLEALGVVVVCAAGNDGRDLDTTPIFPAAVDRPGVIAVMAIDRTGAPLGAGETPSPAGLRSAVGARRVAIAAPGIDLIAAGPRTRLVVVEGTSFAAPLVAAAAAAVLAQEPQRTPAEVAQRLIELSEPLPGLRGLARGGALRLP